MATILLNYGTPTTIAITVASLANAGWRMSDIVDNATSDKFVDAIVGGLIRVGTLTAIGFLGIYAYGTWDGTEYTAGLNTAADATITWGTTGRSGLVSYHVLPLLGLIPTDSTDDDDHVSWGPYSIASAFGGAMPRKWGLVVYNSTGAALQATQTDTVQKYTGIKYSSL